MRKHWSVITPMPTSLIAAMAKLAENSGVEGSSRREPRTSGQGKGGRSK